MRYSLHNPQGQRIGESETAQGIADIARPGTWSYDTRPGGAFPCVVYARDSMGLIGTPYRYRFEAMRAASEVQS
jgi:hypothetical protein